MGSAPSVVADHVLFDNPNYHDVVINYRQTKTYAHKAILALRSKFFLKAFTKGFLETKGKTIELDFDEDPKAVLALLHHCYELPYNDASIIGPNKGPNLAFHASVFKIADKYDCPSLRDKILDNFEDYAAESSSILDGPFDELFEVHAMIYGEKLADNRLRKAADKYLKHNIYHILQHKSLKSFQEEEGSLSGTLMEIFLGCTTVATLRICFKCRVKIQGPSVDHKCQGRLTFER
ncbi:hypothetical protein M438DRAFT_354726 [Aureobasidium pullulans EXF-150]|uniref:BTB domain-containing protein n=1 Tax=Aureobasidium pullulans EXF-150 TaxID=1043002 RepID=A0A074XJL6_AURPU|nr:uncharacterized protein M438DRAFT_354726 [Aureobasidium pullulans EXF-150]KEQ85683.1 hypothetical protein M438DRAFT_354726 [Aureobasidium pullulans EXF-150]